MNYSKIEKLLRANPKGVTITPEGQKVIIKKGYVVSLTNNITTKKRLHKTLLGINRFCSRMGTDKNEIVGCWKDKGRWFVDCSYIIESKRDARQIAKAYNQKAIYDFKKQKTITV